MSFDLKKANVTYQLTINAIFQDFIYRFMEIYIDGVVVKSRDGEMHLTKVCYSFLRIRQQLLPLTLLNVFSKLGQENFWVSSFINAGLR